MYMFCEPYLYTFSLGKTQTNSYQIHNNREAYHITNIPIQHFIPFYFNCKR
ncbi:hypothetical protein Lalb_Chr09g0326071 [Lupinus albus]|uniref:Uncharacterized protein n=1 Tax=Lupinus albus TaxID=3870 RepID=A0A6A4PZW6_LUPAL|nr:hypothetical protein Lalb_Chr09g0326071 [Lupinus albus]